MNISLKCSIYSFVTPKVRICDREFNFLLFGMNSQGSSYIPLASFNILNGSSTFYSSSNLTFPPEDHLILTSKSVY